MLTYNYSYPTLCAKLVLKDSSKYSINSNKNILSLSKVLHEFEKKVVEITFKEKKDWVKKKNKKDKRLKNA